MDRPYCITFVELLKAVPDSRHRRGCRYAWWFLLVVIASALLQGQRSARGMAQWATWHAEELRTYLSVDYPQMPSASTLRRTLARLDIVILEAQMALFARRIERSLRAEGQGECSLSGLALDGKDLRTASAYGEPVKLLSCVRHGLGLTLGQQRIPAHQGEVSTAYRLLAQQDLRQTVVTADAAFTGRPLLQQILAQEGEYLVVVKPNCGELYDDLEVFFGEPRWLKDVDYYQDNSWGHGRQEQHLTRCSTDLTGYLEWPGVQQVLQRHRVSRQGKGGKVTTEVTYAITSLDPTQARAEELERLWRHHWHVENKSHYVRDVTLGEDRCRLRTGHAPEVLAALRNGLLALLRAQSWETIPDALRYYAASLQETLHALGL